MAAAVLRLSEKDRRRFSEALGQLHAVNAQLWEAEDLARDSALPLPQLGRYKRRIDLLNQERNRLIERIDLSLTGLGHDAANDAPLHTETLGSALDRLSVLTLRLFHTARAARDSVGISRSRLPALRTQLDQLRTGLDALVAEVTAGTRRLPSGQRFKLYGREATVREPVRVSPNIDQVIAFGGLSECGKSSSAQYLRYATGTYRFKIGYLLDSAVVRAGLADPYLLPSEQQAELLLAELNRFADAHAEARRFTIESVHDDRLIAALKRHLGGRLRIVYLDVPFPVRVRRARVPEAAVRAKDQVKTDRGAHRVANIADHLVNNSGTVHSLRARLRVIAAPAQPIPVRTSPVPALGLPADVTEAVERSVAALGGDDIGLVALTGSAAEGGWSRGWSDLDLLVVAEQRCAPAVEEAVRGLRRSLAEPDPVKVALTLVTPAEVAARAVQPRVLYSLWRIGSGQHPVLHVRPDLRLPRVEPDEVALAAERELPVVVVTLRRLRALAGTDRFDLRATYKHLLLVCRLALHIQGHWVPDQEEVVPAARRELDGLSGFEVPPLTTVRDAYVTGTEERVTDAVLAAADELLDWYEHQLIA
ncbi:hypothetical protein LI90_276 [Carbonactinospora thermoautotrophica]|uniref:Uncharacterized protein n=1 Tax=Carbonactinospora thermoautotrophica TaxID=1469144 RepID=A0A132MLM7_9ACTN|nr:DUF4254 domain-containing protein [Carbonactinospora thermoautotrophica]KWW98649.1 hypothetical protein LI90_276 [Carbonactinospora thermoautotrophica]